MQNRDDLLEALALAYEDENNEAVNQIALELKTLDEKASMKDLVPTASPDAEKERTTWSYVVDQMKKRYGDYADLLVRGGMNTAYDPRVWNSLPEEAKEAVRNRVSQNKSAQYAETMLGYEGFEPRDKTEEYLGVVGAASVDPVTLLPVGRVITGGKYLLNTTKPYALALLEWTTGTASETAGYAGAELAAQGFKGTEYEDTTIDYITRFASAFVAGTAPSALTRTIQSTKAGYDASRSIVQENADVLSEVFTNQSVKSVLDAAIKSQGATFGERLKAAEKLQEMFPELVLPLVDVVGENAILAKEFRKLYSANPEFRNKYDEAAKKVAEQFQMYQEGVFPSPLKKGEQIRNPILDEANTKAIEAQAKKDKKIQNIETVKSKIAERYDEAPLAANIEKAAKNVAESSEKAAREASSAYYTKAFEYANANGVTVPTSAVQNLWNFAKAQRQSDLFAEFPALYRKINQIFKPEQVEGTGLLDMRGNLLRPKMSLEFPDVSVEDLDSLKRELNKSIRTTTDRAKQASLGDLKDELDRQIRAIDPKFAELYRAADKKYYESVGLPTSLEGYRAVDSARFSTSVAEALTKPDQIKDYLNFVGRDAGINVVRDAFLMKARRSILTASGDVDPNKLKAFVARNRDALDQIPEIKAIFNEDALLAERINRGRAKIESNYNAYALEQSEGFFKALNNKNLDKIANDVINNPSNREQYLSQINTLSTQNKKVALTGLRQAVLDKAFSSNGTVVDYIKENQQAFDDLFGSEYSEQVQNLARLRDIIDTNKENLVSSSISHAQNTQFKKIAGFTEEEAIGTIRNQVMSNARKFLHLFFKAVVTKNNAKADKAMADVLLDTKGLKALNEEAKRLEEALKQSDGTAKLAGKAFFNFMKTFSSTLGGYITLGGVRGTAGATINDELENETSLMPTLEEDDWLFAPKQLENAPP